MAPPDPTGLRSPEVRSGLGLLGKTLLQYRADSVRSILGALLWMALVVAIPYVVARIIDDAIRANDLDLLVPLVALLMTAGLFQALGVGLRRYYGFRLSYRAEADLRNRMFVHMQKLGFSFHDETPTGQLMSRASSDLGQVRLIFAKLPITLANMAMFVVVIAVLVLIDPVLGAASALTIPALFLSATAYAKRSIGLSFEIQERLAIPASTLAHHLKFLAAAGLVEQERHGRTIVNRAAYDRLQGLADFLLQACCSEPSDNGVLRALATRA